MIRRWVTTCAVLGVLAAPMAERLQAQPAAPAAAVPAWVPPPAPAPPVTLWRFLGIPQGFQRIGDARLNRSGNFPGLERKPPLKPIAHPDNLLSNNPAIKKAAEIKMQEDMAKQKIKAIKYLAKLGCDKCYGGVKEAMMAALDDCTEQVRYEAAKALGEAAVQHCDVCSRQCCCDEELTKKLAQIVYELDDKGCPLEPSERVREMAKEALEACCPNVGPPVVPEVIDGGETPPVIDGETPPPTRLETPPATIPELPPPAIPNGAAPQPNGDVTPRPMLPPEASNQRFLRSRADRMAATSQVRRAPVVRRAAKSTAPIPFAQRPIVELPVPQQSFTQTPLARLPAAQTPAAQVPAARVVVRDHSSPAARIVASDQNSWPKKPVAGARVSLQEPDAKASAKAVAADGSTMRIRISDAPGDANHASSSSESAASPRQSPPLSLSEASTAAIASDEGTVVRIRDSADDLQLASAQDIAAPEVKMTSVVSSRRSAVTVSDLFAPPTSDSASPAASQPRAAAAQPSAEETVTSIAPLKPGAKTAKVQGRLSNIDFRAGTVQFRFNQGEAPATGTMVKVYHQFLLGEECVGALEVVSVQNGVATARPVGNVVLNKLSVRDHVAY